MAKNHLPAEHRARAPRGSGAGSRAAGRTDAKVGMKAGAKERTIDPWSGMIDAARDDGRLVREAREGPGRAKLVDIPAQLHPDVVAGLGRIGVERLYSHQAEAIESAWEQTTIVTTGTASGKSLCFNLPTLDALCRDAFSRALYLYPTKALAQDQARALGAFGLTKQVRPAIYDGDTPRDARGEVRRRANIVLTNPDMLHVGILPHHGSWERLFSHLRIVVVDEAHVYRGVFGSHVANVLRRLLRVAAAYGSDVRVLLTSATISNPVELAERLTGLDDIGLIDRDGSPTPRRQIAMWNPPLTDEALGTRRSALGEAAELVAQLVRDGGRAICFMKSRKGVELLARMVTEDLERADPDLAERVAPYRAGYTPQQRRALEARLTSGELRAVITTDALELGIDIGELDAAVVVTFPGTVASLRQMWGRAGRRGKGLAVYVAGEDALDQFFCRHPDDFLERPVEAAILDHESPQIHQAHLLCAAYEGPLGREDAEFFGPRFQAHAEALVSAGLLRKRAENQYVLRRPGDYPAAKVSLRSSSPDSFAIVDVSSGELLGQTETARAHSTVHDGAVYLHQGRSYEVRELDLENRRALVAPFDGDWYTQPKRETDTTIERLLDRRDTLGVSLSFGEVSVTETVLAYQRKRLADHTQVDLVMLDLPQTSFSTQALWFELDPDRLTGLPGGGSNATVARDVATVVGTAASTPIEIPLDSLLGSLHATEHAQIAVLPLIAMCDRWDIGGLSTNVHPQTGGPTIFVYDGHPGGVGITRQAYLRFEELCRDAHRLIAECPCKSGCPSCVQSPKCGNLNEPLSKSGALVVLEGMLAAGVEVASVP
ncbi:MAG TPA: DEAD/DEAH box helicase [Solirubrobacteraceae bacterium]|nr:DEAD/DEAH box helicase [Solirubrobacteraceae bacterium]